MKIELNGTNFLRPGVSQTTRSALSPSTQKALEQAKQHLPEINGTSRQHIPPNITSKESLFEHFINTINDKQQTAQARTRDVLNGTTDNLHQSVLATQEAGLAFTLLLEMRNKLVEGFKELMRMSI